MKKITVLTPTYNRVNLLKRTYKSLLNQNVKEFTWMIVDDGSEDETETFIRRCIDENLIEIKYYKKQNGGKHTAINYGAKMINTELTVILDSDDYFIETAIEDILVIHDIHCVENKNICGYTFLKKYPDNKLMGDKFPYEGIYNFIKWRVNGVVSGDQCDIVYTNFLKDYPFSEYNNEKYIGESTLWIKLGMKYDMICCNKAIYVADYLENGLTKKGRILRLKSPNGSMEYANLCTLKKCSLKRKIIYTPLYLVYGLISKKSIYNLIKVANNKFYTFLNIPISIVIYKYWRKKYKL